MAIPAPQNRPTPSPSMPETVSTSSVNNKTSDIALRKLFPDVPESDIVNLGEGRPELADGKFYIFRQPDPNNFVLAMRNKNAMDEYKFTYNPEKNEFTLVSKHTIVNGVRSVASTLTYSKSAFNELLQSIKKLNYKSKPPVKPHSIVKDGGLPSHAISREVLRVPPGNFYIKPGDGDKYTLISQKDGKPFQIEFTYKNGKFTHGKTSLDDFNSFLLNICAQNGLGIIILPLCTHEHEILKLIKDTLNEPDPDYIKYSVFIDKIQEKLVLRKFTW